MNWSIRPQSWGFKLTSELCSGTWPCQKLINTLAKKKKKITPSFSETLTICRLSCLGFYYFSSGWNTKTPFYKNTHLTQFTRENILAFSVNRGKLFHRVQRGCKGSQKGPLGILASTLEFWLPLIGCVTTGKLFWQVCRPCALPTKYRQVSISEDFGKD